MTDDRWEPLDRLADSAPRPDAGFADRMLARGRLGRRRRRTGLALASAGTVVAIVVGSLALAAPHPSTGGAPAATTPTSGATPVPHVVSDRVQVAAEALAVAVTRRPWAGQPERVALDGRHCSGKRWTHQPGQCERWTSEEFVDLTRALADTVTLVLVTADEGNSLARGALPVRDMVYAQVDGIDVVGDSARVGVYVTAPKQCAAAVYRLARLGTGWRVARTIPADIAC